MDEKSRIQIKEKLMRDYLFKGLDENDNKTWRYGDYMRYEGLFMIYNRRKSISYRVVPFSVHPWIGEYDRNHLRIFEGDRLYYPDEEFFGTVVYYNGYYYLESEKGYASMVAWSHCFIQRKE
jgi:hypothetical protein